MSLNNNVTRLAPAVSDEYLEESGLYEPLPFPTGPVENVFDECPNTQPGWVQYQPALYEPLSVTNNMPVANVFDEPHPAQSSWYEPLTTPTAPVGNGVVYEPSTISIPPPTPVAPVEAFSPIPAATPTKKEPAKKKVDEKPKRNLSGK